jgi:GNAT superfamily N-acetyltransferase
VITVRPARRGEAAILTALCLRSKAHWGYDAAFMELCVPSLTVHEKDIAAGRVLVAAEGEGPPLALAEIRGEGETVELQEMFVDPPAIGSGLGRTMFEAAAALARGLGAQRMTILADLNAARFYERMGARFLRNEPSDAIPGRVLPFYEYDLTSGVPS